MKAFQILLFGWSVFPFFTLAQQPTAMEVLDKSIAYHDPEGHWATFSGTLAIEMTAPQKGKRMSQLELNFPRRYFKSTVTQEGTTSVSEWANGICTYWLNGSQDISEEQRETYRLNCKRTTQMRDYYAYLYGLPMKLKDPGTRLQPEVQEVNWRGAVYLRLRVDYDPEVGKDRWYFYFDPNSYQLRHYQFYHDEAKNDGEYILLSEEIDIQGMKIPKIRAWYTNKDERHLGTDVLVRGS
ncbi:MAG: DUF6503 family protein [Flavobacteriaceae bacterium]